MGEHLKSPVPRARAGKDQIGRSPDPAGSDHASPPPASKPVGDRAVVIGGSIGGTLAARILSEHYREVVVLDRDEVIGVTGPRRGVPHGVHAHGLHARGYRIVTELFPGISDEAAAQGLSIRDYGRMRWYFDGRPIHPADTGLRSIAGNRPLLENHLRSRVAAMPNVTYRQRTETLGLLTNRDRTRVTGIRLLDRDGDGAEHDLGADLVVDATGRGSRLPVWLSEIGYERPAEERIKVGLAYTTRAFLRRPGTFDGPQSINPIASPAYPRGAFFGQAASGRCLLSLTGMAGDHPPTDDEGFLEFTRSLPVPDIYDAVRDAEPMTDLLSFKFPTSVWRHYERLARFPDRLVVFGDAIASFNPVYGQGMTVASMQALALREHLRRHPILDSSVLRHDFALAITEPWRFSTRGDLNFPGVVGDRPLRVRMHNAYMSRLQYAAAKDAKAAAALMRVTGLVDPISSLWHPRLVARVLWISRDAHKRSGKGSANQRLPED